jgi:hypothetical protein
MEGLTRLVSESLARHGFDRPLDYRRLQWSRWFRCESLQSFLYVPSKPGVFALAEEVMDLGKPHVGTAALGCPGEQGVQTESRAIGNREGHDFSANAAISANDSRRPDSYQGTAFSRAAADVKRTAALAAEGRRMLSVLQFFEDDDMAYILDRMLSRRNPMSARLSSGNCFVRFVVIGDETQRRNICTALNQWLLSTGEKATGIGAHFAAGGND